MNVIMKIISNNTYNLIKLSIFGIWFFPSSLISKFRKTINKTINATTEDNVRNKIENQITIDKVKYNLSTYKLKNIEPENDFFDKLYKKYYIHRIPVRRNIAAKKENRGIINEILVSNIKI